MLRNIFLENWRNKLVALIFAVSIWFVTYQSEKQPYRTTLDIRFIPSNPADTIITETSARSRRGLRTPFRGGLQVVFSGPRKEIELLRDRYRRESVPFNLRVTPDQDRYMFRPEDFGFPREGISIIQMQPESVEIQQEPVEEILIEDLRDSVQLQPKTGRGFEVFKEILEPETGSVKLRVPASIKDRISLVIAVPRPLTGENVERMFQLRIQSSVQELVDRTARIWDWRLNDWVNASEAPNVHLRLRLKEKDESFQRDAVKLTFRLPIAELPYKIELHDVSSDTIPVKFSGPREAIDRLQRKFEEQPAYSLSVSVPRFDPDKGGTFTFGEDDLELHGFPEIRILQHENRRQELKSLWSYEVKVFPSKIESGGN